MVQEEKSVFNKLRNQSQNQNISFVNKIAKQYGLSEDRIQKEKQQAVNDYNNDKQEFYDQLTYIRKSGFQHDLNNNMLWSGIILLFIIIIGRYLIKLIKWTNNNKSKD